MSGSYIRIQIRIILDRQLLPDMLSNELNSVFTSQFQEPASKATINKLYKELNKIFHPAGAHRDDAYKYGDGEEAKTLQNSVCHAIERAYHARIEEIFRRPSQQQGEMDLLLAEIFDRPPVFQLEDNIHGEINAHGLDAPNRQRLIQRVEEQIQHSKGAKKDERYRCWFNLHVTQQDCLGQEPILLGRLLGRFDTMPLEIQLATAQYVRNFFRARSVAIVTSSRVHTVLGISAETFNQIREFYSSHASNVQMTDSQLNDASKQSLKTFLKKEETDLSDAELAEQLFLLCQTLSEIQEHRLDVTVLLNTLAPQEYDLFWRIAKAESAERQGKDLYNKFEPYCQLVYAEQGAQWEKLCRDLEQRASVTHHVKTLCEEKPEQQDFYKSVFEFNPRRPTSLVQENAKIAQLEKQIGGFISFERTLMAQLLKLASGITGAGGFTAQELKDQLLNFLHMRLQYDLAEEIIIDSPFMHQLKDIEDKLSPDSLRKAKIEGSSDLLCQLIIGLYELLLGVIDDLSDLKKLKPNKIWVSEGCRLMGEAEDYLKMLKELHDVPLDIYSTDDRKSKIAYAEHMKLVKRCVEKMHQRPTASTELHGDENETSLWRLELAAIEKQNPLLAIPSNDFPGMIRRTLFDAITALLGILDRLALARDAASKERRQIYKSVCQEYVQAYRSLCAAGNVSSEIQMVLKSVNEVTQSRLIENQAKVGNNRRILSRVGYGFLAVFTVGYGLGLGLALLWAYHKWFSPEAAKEKESAVVLEHVGRALAETRGMIQASNRTRRAGVVPEELPRYSTVVYCREKGLLREDIVPALEGAPAR